MMNDFLAALLLTGALRCDFSFAGRGLRAAEGEGDRPRSFFGGVIDTALASPAEESEPELEAREREDDEAAAAFFFRVPPPFATAGFLVSDFESAARFFLVEAPFFGNAFLPGDRLLSATALVVRLFGEADFSTTGDFVFFRPVDLSRAAFLRTGGDIDAFANGEIERLWGDLPEFFRGDFRGDFRCGRPHLAITWR